MCRKATPTWLRLYSNSAQHTTAPRVLVSSWGGFLFAPELYAPERIHATIDWNFMPEREYKHMGGGGGLELYECVRVQELELFECVRVQARMRHTPTGGGGGTLNHRLRVVVRRACAGAPNRLDLPHGKPRNQRKDGSHGQQHRNHQQRLLDVLA